MAIRQAKEAMNPTKAHPEEASRVRYAPSAKNPAVAATYPIVCPNKTCVSPLADPVWL